MSKIKVPSFLTKLTGEHRRLMIKQWGELKSYECIELLTFQLEDELERLIQQDEKTGPVTWFQTKWSQAKRHGRRMQLRLLIKDLT